MTKLEAEKTAIFDIYINDISQDEMIEHIIRSAVDNEKIIVSYVNVHALNLAYKSARFRHYFQQSDYVFCDGFGVKWGAYLVGHHLSFRYTPPDWIDFLCERLEKKNLSIYLLGAKPGITEQAAANLIKRHPDLKIVGRHHGFFNKSYSSQENQKIIESLNELRPNILILGFGMPLQEYWLMENWHRINANVAIPAGALFDYLAGTVPRAPKWMTDNGLEWLGRLLIEPGRLWKRYVIGNPLFFWRIMKQRFGLLRFPD